MTPQHDSASSLPLGGSVAIVGAGVSGLTAAYLLSRTHRTTLFESQPRLGGHVDTHLVPPESAGHVERRVDSGFIVCNDRTYPTLLRLFAELDVRIRPTQMSMSVQCDGCGLEYAGGMGLGGVFAQRRRIVDPRFLGLLVEVNRFQRAARRLAAEDPDSPMTFGEFLDRHRFSSFFVRHYAAPVVSCVWSSGDGDALGYPAGYLFSFLANHGFLALGAAPQWFVVEGGSATYVEALASRIGQVRAGRAVTSVVRGDDGVLVEDASGLVERFDAVVMATHADEALTMLADASVDEKDVLGAFRYSTNQVLVHRDDSVLPSTRAARASWNVRLPACEESVERVSVDYWMNRLQHLDGRFALVVSLNPAVEPAAELVVARRSYTHPVYSVASRAAQRRLAALNSGRTAFAGAYHGWGFHEDGCVSGVRAAEHFGATW